MPCTGELPVAVGPLAKDAGVGTGSVTRTWGKEPISLMHLLWREAGKMNSKKRKQGYLTCSYWPILNWMMVPKQHLRTMCALIDWTYEITGDRRTTVVSTPWEYGVADGVSPVGSTGGPSPAEKWMVVNSQPDTPIKKISREQQSNKSTKIA